MYRHPATDPLPIDHDRIFASPAVDAGESWHPFAEKVVVDGALKAIRMPHAEVGFAIASHHLWMAEGSAWSRSTSMSMSMSTPPANPPKSKKACAWTCCAG